MEVTFINLMKTAPTAPPARAEMVRGRHHNFMDPKILQDVVEWMSLKVSTEEIPELPLYPPPVTNPDGYRPLDSNEPLHPLQRKLASSRENPLDLEAQAYSRKAIAMLDWNV